MTTRQSTYMNDKHIYEVTSKGHVLGTLKAKDLHCATKQARKKYWPIGQSHFTFQVCIKRDVTMSSI